MRLRGARALGFVLATMSCAAPKPPAARETTAAEWRSARGRLASMQASQMRRPYVVLLRVAMREPTTGKVFEARGALAIAPHSAMRMILLGPAGNTALDVWVTPEKWRFVVPALNLTRRGGVGLESARGLPIAFFRWWFLAPLDGRLLTASIDRAGPSFVLRDPSGGTVLLRVAAGGGLIHVGAVRRDAGAVHAVEWRGRNFTPHPGDRARYLDRESGLQVRVLVEEVSPDEPDPGAFLDPDDPGVVL